MILKVKIKSVYGNDVVYPDCDISRTFVSLLGRKTLTSRDIDHIKALGYKIVVNNEVVEL